MPGPHQIRPHILAGTHQIPGSLIRAVRNPYRGYLPQQGQPGQMFGVAGIFSELRNCGGNRPYYWPFLGSGGVMLVRPAAWVKVGMPSWVVFRRSVI